MAFGRRLQNLSTRPAWAFETTLVSRAFTRDVEMQVRNSLGGLARQNVNRAADYLWRRCREAVNVPFPPASQPYAPPRRRTGTGRNAIKKRFGTRGTPSAWVYVDYGPGEYMGDHEVGDVPNVLPRPWLSYTYDKYEDRIQNILTSGTPRVRNLGPAR